MEINTISKLFRWKMWFREYAGRKANTKKSKKDLRKFAKLQPLILVLFLITNSTFNCLWIFQSSRTKWKFETQNQNKMGLKQEQNGEFETQNQNKMGTEAEQNGKSLKVILINHVFLAL